MLTDRFQSRSEGCFAQKGEDGAAYLKAVLDSVHEAVLVHDGATGRILDVNDRVCEMYGYTRDEILGQSAERLSLGESPYSEAEIRVWQRKARVEGPQTFEWRARHADGRLFWVEVSVRYAVIGGDDRFVVVVRDIDGRKRAEEEREKLHSRLLQVEKMESIGQLAGGVAHDFNNTLGVILGHAELALQKTPAGDPRRDDLEQIRRAAEHSAAVTRQLFTFARKQVHNPKVVGLNEAVEGALEILRRFIRENIELDLHAGKGLWPVKVDPAQIEQVLASLCANSRDAIRGTGRIVIETTNITVCPGQAGKRAGDYVRLAVRDNGCGMERETLDRLFEPFFTTKAPGQGTGLGLSAVYGIIRQNDGFIEVESTPGKGASFDIYFPRWAGSVDEAAMREKGELPKGNGETILLAEDDASVLRLAGKILTQLGYRVLEASDPESALALAAGNEAIDLLVADAVMPGGGGRELAARVLRVRPAIGVLYMSGYRPDSVGMETLPEVAAFLQKPFTREELARQVRAALD